MRTSLLLAVTLLCTTACQTLPASAPTETPTKASTNAPPDPPSLDATAQLAAMAEGEASAAGLLGGYLDRIEDVLSTSREQEGQATCMGSAGVPRRLAREVLEPRSLTHGDRA